MRSVIVNRTCRGVVVMEEPEDGFRIGRPLEVKGKFLEKG